MLILKLLTTTLLVLAADASSQKNLQSTPPKMPPKTSSSILPKSPINSPQKTLADTCNEIKEYLEKKAEWPVVMVLIAKNAEKGHLAWANPKMCNLSYDTLYEYLNKEVISLLEGEVTYPKPHLPLEYPKSMAGDCKHLYSRMAMTVIVEQEKKKPNGGGKLFDSFKSVLRVGIAQLYGDYDNIADKMARHFPGEANLDDKLKAYTKRCEDVIKLIDDKNTTSFAQVTHKLSLLVKQNWAEQQVVSMLEQLNSSDRRNTDFTPVINIIKAQNSAKGIVEQLNKAIGAVADNLGKEREKLTKALYENIYSQSKFVAESSLREDLEGIASKIGKYLVKKNSFRGFEASLMAVGDGSYDEWIKFSSDPAAYIGKVKNAKESSGKSPIKTDEQPNKNTVSPKPAPTLQPKQPLPKESDSPKPAPTLQSKQPSPKGPPPLSFDEALLFKMSSAIEKLKAIQAKMPKLTKELGNLAS